MLWVFCRGIAQSTTVPDQHLQPRPLPVREQEQVPTQGILPQLILHLAIQAIEAFSHVHRCYAEEDLCRRPQPEHQTCSSVCTSLDNAASGNSHWLSILRPLPRTMVNPPELTDGSTVTGTK